MALQDLHDDIATEPTAIDVQPVSIHIGAEIGGVDLTKPLSVQQVTEIRNALLKWKVVFFRDQRLDHDQHIAFARQFGDATAGHVVYGSDDKHPEIYAVAKNRKANRFQGDILLRAWSGWHADITAAINPPFASILRGDVVPPYGGDTQWTNLAAAYDALSPTMRGFLDGLRGMHRFAPPPGVEASEEYRELMRKRTLATEHPLVRVHPETGERVLYISPSFLKSVVGLTPRESQSLLEMLWEHAVRPEFTVRFKWEPGSIAFWDNRATAHIVPTDIPQGQHRSMQRITIAGDIPVGPDGRASQPLSGPSFQ